MGKETPFLRDLKTKIKQREDIIRRLSKENEVLAETKRIYEAEAGTDISSAVPTPRPNSHSAELTGTIEVILLEERPLHRRVILERVTQRGIYVGGEKPLASLGSYLSMDRRFKNVGRGIWTLTDEPAAPAAPHDNVTESTDLLTLAGSVDGLESVE